MQVIYLETDMNLDSELLEPLVYEPDCLRFLPLLPPLPGQSKWTFCLGSELVLLHPLGTELKKLLCLMFSWLLRRGRFMSVLPPIVLQEGKGHHLVFFEHFMIVHVLIL